MRRENHITKYSSIHLMLAIAYLVLEMFQMDVKTSFLNVELDTQPTDCEVKESEHKVCRLKRCISAMSNEEVGDMKL